MWKRLALILCFTVCGGWGLHGTATGWFPLKIGGGGLLSGIDRSVDGSTWIVRTDTYGAYLCDTISSGVCQHWAQIVSRASMPNAAAFVDNSQGVYEIAVAPNTPTRLYMVFRNLTYVSSDRGATWTQTACPTFANANPNDGDRQKGHKIAVDPANADVAYFGTPSAGLYVTTDAGATCTNVAPVPASTGTQGLIITFDPTSGTTGGKTNTIYVSSYGNGVYLSTDAGVNFNITTNTPTTHQKLIVAGDGIPYLLDDQSAPAHLWKYSSGAWSDVSPGGTVSWRAVLADPNNAARLVLIGNNSMESSLNRGASWVFVPTSYYSPTCSGGVDASQFRSASDVPWLGPSGTKECAFTIGNAMFDTSVANRIHLSEGVGVWYMDFGTASTQPNTTQTWNSETVGIEQLVANWVLSPPGGNPITFSWDRGIFYRTNVNAYPTAQTYNIAAAILPSWGGDYATTDSTFIVGVTNTSGTQDSGYSTDGGQTWNIFASMPTSVGAGKNAGSIAAYDHNLIVFCPNDNGNPAYTKNGGTSWTDLDFSSYSVPTTGETGWGFSSLSTNRHICAVDRVTPRTFYLYNYGPTGHTGVAGVYRVVFDVSGTPTVTKAISGTLVAGGVSSGFNASMRSVPGKAGELFFTAGQVGGSTAGVFSHLVDSGAGGDNTMTATIVANILEVYAFGFGATKPGGDYPTVYIYGALSSTFSYYRSEGTAAQWAANTQTWTDYGPYPLNTFDTPKAVEGDANTYGRVYVGWLGSGFGYGQFPYLLNRDLNPAANDNSPVGLPHVA